MVKLYSKTMWLSLNNFFHELHADVLRIEKHLACCGFCLNFFVVVDLFCYNYSIYKPGKTTSKSLLS